MLKKKPRSRKPAKPLLKIDGAVYASPTLYAFHVKCKAAKETGIIRSFEVPVSLAAKSRYTTYKPVIDEIRFDSLMEAEYYLYLMGEKKEKRVKSFAMQVTYELQPKFSKNKKTYRPITYIADFVVELADGTTEVIDVKGKETESFKLKRKLFEYQFSDLTLRTVQYSAENEEWLDTETIRKLRKKKSVARK